MARTVETHVDSLLSRNLAEAKASGLPSTDFETSAVFDSIALTLVLHPRTALYFANLARNGLFKTVKQEIDVIDLMEVAIKELSNPSYKIEGEKVLQRAKLALLQLERLPRVDSNSTALKLYENSVEEFLQKHLSKNVRKSGSDTLLRTAAEASLDLRTMTSSLKIIHEELLQRLYDLAVGVDNFMKAPLSALIGSATVSRARADIEEILSAVQAGGDPDKAQDFAVRLIGSRATIKSISARPDPRTELLYDGVPAMTGSAPASVVTSPGPFAIDSSPVAISTTKAPAVGGFTFFINGSSFLVSRALSFPVTVPADYGLFLDVQTTDTTSIQARLPLSGTFTTLQSLLDAINNSIAADASWTSIVAAPFAFFEDRWILYRDSNPRPFSVVSLHFYVEEGVTVDVQAVSAKSAHDLVGLVDGQTGRTTASAQDVADALGSIYDGSSGRAELTVAVGPNETVVLTTAETDPGTFLRIDSAPASLGLAGTTHAISDSVSLVGVDDHRDAIQFGDVVDLNGVRRTVTAVLSEQLKLGESVETFSGALSARSALVESHKAFAADLAAFLDVWSRSRFKANLDRLDAALAALSSSKAPAQQNGAIAELEGLKNQLTSLLNLLGDQSTMLPVGAAQAEKALVDGILTTLQERHFNRAADFLLRCDLQSLMGMTADTASYGGNFLKTASDFAKANFSSVDHIETNTTDHVMVGP